MSDQSSCVLAWLLMKGHSSSGIFTFYYMQVVAHISHRLNTDYYILDLVVTLKKLSAGWQGFYLSMPGFFLAESGKISRLSLIFAHFWIPIITRTKRSSGSVFFPSGLMILFFVCLTLYRELWGMGRRLGLFKWTPVQHWTVSTTREFSSNSAL